MGYLGCLVSLCVWVAVMAEAGRFPEDRLGPFLLVEVPPNEYHLELKDGHYEISGFDESLAPFFSTFVSGPVSASHPVTLSSTARARAGIPESASSFVWLYPSPEVNQLPEEKRDHLPNNAVTNFLLAGGFAYLDSDLTVTHLTTINFAPPGEGLEFEGPYPLSDEAIQHLDTEGRWVPVTLEDIGVASNAEFVWLTPGEDSHMSGFSQPVTHGGFAYKYKNRSESRYFVCKDFTLSDHVSVTWKQWTEWLGERLTAGKELWEGTVEEGKKVLENTIAGGKKAMDTAVTEGKKKIQQGSDALGEAYNKGKTMASSISRPPWVPEKLWNIWYPAATTEGDHSGTTEVSSGGPVPHSEGKHDEL